MRTVVCHKSIKRYLASAADPAYVILGASVCPIRSFNLVSDSHLFISVACPYSMA